MKTNYKRIVENVEKYVRELESDANRLRTKKTKNEMEHLINASDATLMQDIANDLKERLEVE